MIDFNIDGGYFVRDFDINSKDKYIKCIAEKGKSSIFVTPISDQDIKIFFDEVEVFIGVSTQIRLKKDSYGYIIVNVKISDIDDLFEKSFSLAILKPAPNNDILYDLDTKPHFHYTAPYGYIHDLNGIIYNNISNEYHLFYQTNPYALNDGSKHWGHITTKDLMTFKECEIALYPDESGEMGSGSVIIDYNNTAMLYDENTPPEARILLIYYVKAEVISNLGIAYTIDGGKSWIKAENGKKINFIGVHPEHMESNIIWLDEAEKWVMFCSSGEIFTSNNLWDWRINGRKKWKKCSNVYKISAEDSDEIKYVCTYEGVDCQIGYFKENQDYSIDFLSEIENNRRKEENSSFSDNNIESIYYQENWLLDKAEDFYTTKRYAEILKNDIISIECIKGRNLDNAIAWIGAMSIFTERKLHLRKNGEYILRKYPVKEISLLHEKCIFMCQDVEICPNSENILNNVYAAYADINGSFILDENVTELGFKLRKGFDHACIKVKYDVMNEMLVVDCSDSKYDDYKEIYTMSMECPENKTLSIRVLLDSIIVECFGNDGEAYISSAFCRKNNCKDLEFYTVGGNVWIESLSIYNMKSIW